MWVVRNPSWTTKNGVCGRLGRAARDGREVGRLLGVPGEHDAPAGVGDAHDVVVAGVDVQGLAGEGPRADVEHDRQALAAEDVQDLLHEDQALARREVRRAPPARATPSAADAELCSDSGSMKRSGVPQRFGRPAATAAWKIAAIVVDGVIG